MTPDEIVGPLVGSYDLPKSVAHLLFLLVYHELETDFKEFHDPRYDGRDPAYKLKQGLRLILSRLPPLEDAGDGKFITTVGELAQLSEAEQQELCQLATDSVTPWRLQRGLSAEENVQDLQRRIDLADREDDLRLEKLRLREYKNDLAQARRELKEVEDYLPPMPSIFTKLLAFTVSFTIPAEVRASHTHVIGTTGSGKSTLLAQLCVADCQTDASVIVISPKGFLIPLLSRLECVAPDRLLMILPERDSPAINIFQLAKGKDEDVANQIVDLLVWVFSSLIDADLSHRSGTLLEFCIRLLLLEPDSTIRDLHTLMASKELPEKYKKHLPKLAGVAQTFFTKSFNDHTNTGYGQSKGSVLAALNSFLSNPNNERMFTQTENRIDLNSIFEKGQILLVDTSLKKLGDNGAQFLAKLIVGLVNIATQQRDINKPLRPVRVYVDEAWMALSAAAEKAFVLAREANVGLTIAHQDLGQLNDVSPKLINAVFGAHTRFAGTCVPSDRPFMANQVHCETEQLRDRDDHGFMFFCKTPKFPKTAILLRPNKQYLEHLDRRKTEEMEALYAANSIKVCSQQRPALRLAAEPQPEYETPKGATVDYGTKPSSDW